MLSRDDFVLEKPLDNFGTQAIIVSRKNDFFLVFRGTQFNGLEIMFDLYSDLNVQPKIDGEIKFHEGFYDSYYRVEKDIVEFLKGNLKDGKNLYITGHSLGGALATIATWDLEKKFREKIGSCYTFGSPAVASKNLEKSTPIFRIITNYDIVPRIIKDFKPLMKKINKKIQKSSSDWTGIDAEKCLSYIHSGSAYPLNKGNKALIEYSAEKFLPWLTFKFFIFRCAGDGFWNALLGDHKIRNYINEVKKIIQ